MATMTLTINDAHLPKVREALCVYIGLHEAVDWTNANAKAGLIQMVRNEVRNNETLKATSAAIAAIVPPADTDVT